LQAKENIEYRVIFFHIQSASARMRFLYFKQRNSVLGFSSLDNLSVLIEKTEESEDLLQLETHNNAILQYIEQKLLFDLSKIELKYEFCYCIDNPNKLVVVALARFQSIDPPFELSEGLDAQFCELPSLRKVHQVELELLQKAYHLIIG